MITITKQKPLEEILPSLAKGKKVYLIGCGTCALVCPLGVPKLDKAQKKMVKCDLCQDEEIPVCVANCPNEALVYMEEKPDTNPVVNYVNNN